MLPATMPPSATLHVTSPPSTPTTSANFYACAAAGGCTACPGHAHTTQATGFTTPRGINYSRCRNAITITERGTIRSLHCTISKIAYIIFACTYRHWSQRTCYRYLYHPGCSTDVIFPSFVCIQSHMLVLF
jgi:hypothetical protein